MFGFRKLLREIAQRLGKIEDSLETMYQTGSHGADELTSGLKELRNATNQHDMAIEDLLDSWEELQEEQRKEKESMTAALIETMAREQRQTAQREQSLLQLCMTAMDQLFALHRAADEAGAEEWSQQLKLTEDKLGAVSLPAGFQVIGDVGAPVDYGIHEVIDVQVAEIPGQENTVAEVISRGYCHMGTILRKARVSVYRKAAADSGAEERRTDGDRL